MRVIGGESRGRILKAPSGYRTRPTSDKVREAIFDMLPHRLEGLKALDLFAGSGAMGIEALSRGAIRAVFIESSRVVSAVIKANIRACNLDDRAKVMVGRLPQALMRVLKMEGPFDIVFIDPPYEKGLAEKTLDVLIRGSGVAPGGRVVIEHSAREETPEETADLVKIRMKRYGSTAVSIYERESLKDGQKQKTG